MPPSQPERRSYFSPMRQRQAEETRRAILQAARASMLDRGYAATTIEGVAAAAGVAPQTVTSIFSNKRGLLMAVVKEAAFGPRHWELIEQTRTTKKPADYLDLVAKIARNIYESAHGELQVLYSAIGVAAELNDLKCDFDTQRRGKESWAIKQIADQHALRRDPQEAADIVWALTSPELYKNLVVDCSWLPERYEAWLAEMLKTSLLAKPD